MRRLKILMLAVIVGLFALLMLLPPRSQAASDPTATPSETATVTSTPTPTPTTTADHLQSGLPVQQTGLPDLLISDIRLFPNADSNLGCDFSDETVLLVVVANYGTENASGVSVKVHQIGVRPEASQPTAVIDYLGAGQVRWLRFPMALIGQDGVEVEVSSLRQESSLDNNRLIVTWKQLLMSYTAVPRCTPTFTPSTTLTPSITLTPTFGPSPTFSDTPTSTPT